MSEQVNLDEVLLSNSNNKISEIDRLTTVVSQMVQDFKNLRSAVEQNAQNLSALFKTIEEGRVLNMENIYDCLINIRVAQLDHFMKQQVEKGFLKSVDVATGNSVVVCRQYGQDSKEINRKISMPLAEVKEEFKNKFIGQKVGSSVVIENKVGSDTESTMVNNTFHILEIYELADRVDVPVA